MAAAPDAIWRLSRHHSRHDHQQQEEEVELQLLLQQQQTEAAAAQSRASKTNQPQPHIPANMTRHHYSYATHTDVYVHMTIIEYYATSFHRFVWMQIRDGMNKTKL